MRTCGGIQLVSMRRGFTLIELVLSSAVLAMIGAALSSVMLMAARAAPTASGSSGTAAETSSVLAMFAIEVGSASRIIALEPEYVAFTSGDADGDGADEEFMYGYASGTGELIRSVNGAAATVMSGVTGCTFTGRTAVVSVHGQSVKVARAISIDITPSSGDRVRATARCFAMPEAP